MNIEYLTDNQQAHSDWLSTKGMITRDTPSPPPPPSLPPPPPSLPTEFDIGQPNFEYRISR